MELKPIESAPKDGTWILLVGGETDEDFDGYREVPDCKQRPVVGSWNEVLRGVDAPGYWVYDYWDGAWRSSYSDPTHWAELPDLDAALRPT